MGVAAMMIILCHAPQYGVEVSGILRKLLVFLNIGVDIFLFLSGMGCYFSLMKSDGYFSWLKKRFLRIFIPYTIVLLLLRIIGLGFDNMSWSEWLLYFSTIRFWTHHDGMWYIALLVLLYPITPLLYRTLEHSKKRYLTAIAIIILLLFITHIHVNTTEDLTNSVITNLQWAFKRVVGFVLGMFFAPYVQQHISLNAFYVIASSAFACVLFHFFAKEVFYSWIYILPILIPLCLFFERLSDRSMLNTLFIWLGAASLESYLMNIGIKALMPFYLKSYLYNPLFYGHYLDYTFIIIVGLCLTYVTSIFSKKIGKLVI